MKLILKKIVIAILAFEASLVLKKFKPKIIAVTGSVGKTATKDALYTAIKDSVRVRKNQKSFNSELGVPLTILGLDTGWGSPSLWFKNIVKGFLVIFQKDYPDYLILETGVDRPGDMDVTGSLISPDIIVYTAFGTTPVHVEYFNSPDEVWTEKLKLIKYMKPNGIVVYNNDDKVLRERCGDMDVQKFTFGSEDAQVTFDTISLQFVEGRLVGQKCEIYAENMVGHLTIKGGIGITHLYPAVASVAVALQMNISFDDVLKSLEQHSMPRGRMNILEGRDNITIIDDSYNASPIACHRAIETLSAIETENKKIAVMGDMLELGNFSNAEHTRLGKYIAKNGIDILVTVGLRSKVTATSAIENGMSKDNVIMINKASDVAGVLKGKVNSGDYILFKGSQGIRMERAVEAFLAHPEDKGDLLVRQGTEWEVR